MWDKETKIEGEDEWEKNKIKADYPYEMELKVGGKKIIIKLYTRNNWMGPADLDWNAVCRCPRRTGGPRKGVSTPSECGGGGGGCDGCGDGPSSFCAQHADGYPPKRTVLSDAQCAPRRRRTARGEIIVTSRAGMTYGLLEFVFVIFRSRVYQSAKCFDYILGRF